MGCNVSCPYLPYQYSENWGLEDPTGRDDKCFEDIISVIEKNIKKLAVKLQNC